MRIRSGMYGIPCNGIYYHRTDKETLIITTVVVRCNGIHYFWQNYSDYVIIFSLHMVSNLHNTSRSQSLDVSLERKELLRAIRKYEKQYESALRKLERLKHDLSEFKRLYDARILRLYQRLNILESLLFKYRNISEYVDEIFSFEEAQKIFDETLKDNRARIEDEYKEQKELKKSEETLKNMTDKEKAELKKIYRNLARKYHPDRMGGDEGMMKRINKYYKEGNLEVLRDLDLEHIPVEDDDSLSGLKLRLSIVIRLVEKAETDIVLLRRSDMYVLKRNLLRIHKTKSGNALDHLAGQLRREIIKKEEELEEYKQKFMNKDVSGV